MPVLVSAAQSAPDAPWAVQMVEAMVLDKKRVLPCAAWLQGEFGLRGMFCGVPCKIGRGGLEQIFEVTLTEQERRDLHASAESVRTIQATLSV